MDHNELDITMYYDRIFSFVGIFLTYWHNDIALDTHFLFNVPRFRSFVRLSVCQSVRLSVTKTLTWLMSSEVLMIEHWYLACMILVTSPSYWNHAVTLTFDLLQVQGQIVACGGPQFFEFACSYLNMVVADGLDYLLFLIQCLILQTCVFTKQCTFVLLYTINYFHLLTLQWLHILILQNKIEWNKHA